MNYLIKLFLILAFPFLYSCANNSTSANEVSHLKSGNEKKQDSTSKEDKKNCCEKPEASNTSIITCPKCGYKKTEVLPTEVCQLKYTCEKCMAVLYPKKEDCCVFCSYGDHKCPSMQ